MQTLPDYLAPDLPLLSIGLNPSVNSALAGFYFATPQNRFWKALNASALVQAPLVPGVEAMQILFERDRIGFTDVVKRPSRRGGELRAADYRDWAPVLLDKLRRHRPAIAWFHGKVAWRCFLKYGLRRDDAIRWGQQPRLLEGSRVFVSPNPSPANAAFSLDVLIDWYNRLAALRERLETGENDECR